MRLATLPMRLRSGPPVLDPAAERPVCSRSGPRQAWRLARIAERRVQADGIVSFDLVPADGTTLPPFEAGAHLDVEIAPGLIRQYSLCHSPSDRRRYRITVLRDANSRGGSHRLHETWSAGQTVRVSAPRNAFQLGETSRRSVLIAGGIGVTPLLSMAYRLQELDRDFVLHYCARSAAKAAFVDEIRASALGAPKCLPASRATPSG